MTNREKLDKILKAYNLPNLNYEETAHGNRIITRKENESIIKILASKKSPVPDGFMAEFYPTFKELMLIFPQASKKLKRTE